MAWHPSLILISQIQRSGGTLLSQLFDGHPDVFAFPQELKWGEKKKYFWPDIDPERESFPQIAEALVKLNAKGATRFNDLGYWKSKKAGSNDRLPFCWSYETYTETFLRRCEAERPRSRRDFFDIFFSAYAAALGRADTKRRVTAFTPRGNFVQSYPQNLAFFSDYPDGTMICICRHPADWYASAANHSQKYTDVEKAMSLWRESAESALLVREKYLKQVILLSFSDLVTQVQETMGRLSSALALEWNDCLLTPTFDGSPLLSNSSFCATKQIIDHTAANRRSVLPLEIAARIERTNRDLYERFLGASSS